MDVNYILIIVQKRTFDNEKTMGIYKFKHERTAWEHYQRDLKELPPGTFIQLMTIDNFVRSISRKNYKVVDKPPKPKRIRPRKKPQQRRAIDAIAAGDIPGIERRKDNGKD